MVTLAAWTVVSALVQGGNPWPQVALVAAVALAYSVARSLGARRPVLVSTVIVIAILMSVAVSGRGAFFGGPLAPPLGYANANGALYALGAAAAAVIATFAHRPLDRWLGALAALMMLAMAVVSLSKAAIALTATVLLVAVTARWLGRWVALVAPVIVFVALGMTIVLAHVHGSPALNVLEEGLTERRTTLWQEALDIMAAQPVFGVGPGDFANTSPTALSDADALWAHSAYLEVAAETGIVGLLLLIAVLLWTYGGLYRSKQDPRLVVIGTAAVTALAIHASIDYVIHFAAVVVTAAILAGIASSRGSASADQIQIQNPPASL